MTNPVPSTNITKKSLSPTEYSHFKYLTNRPFVLQWKFVRAAPGESWKDNWRVDDVPSFLVFIARQTKVEKDPQNKRSSLVGLDTYYIWAGGTKDLAYCKGGITLTKANELYDIAADGISYQELLRIGFESY
jgi:hypothetical protein